MIAQLLRRAAAAAAGLVVAVASSAAALAGPAVTPLVATDWLEANLGAADLAVVDVRSATDFARGHIRGAVRTDYPGGWRATRDGVPQSFPDMASVAALAGGLGIGPDTSVVIVPAGGDNTELGISTWIYWVLSYWGHDDVALLDGGYGAWSGEGRAMATGPAALAPATGFMPQPRPEILAETEDVVAALGTATLIIDARPASQYAAGHIPGAVNIDNARLYDLDRHRLKEAAAMLAELPAGLALDAPIIVYCNTGHWSSIVWFALHEVLGFTDVRLYEGSIVAWRARPDLPLTAGLAP